MNNNKKKLLFLGILLLGCVLTSLIGENWDTSENAALPVAEQKSVVEEKQQAVEKTILVHVQGAVLEPGLYKLRQGDRVEQALAAAGGMTAEANTAKVNLAKKLKDGSMVYVPPLKAKRAAADKTGTVSKVPLQAGQKVNLNTAAVEELDLLPGIGPAMAQRIVARREQQPFGRVEDLLQVKGIGKAKLEALREWVTVE